MQAKASIAPNRNELTTASSEKNDPSDRWVNGVLDLIRLTNQGKLRWKRIALPSSRQEEFEAVLGDKRIKLEITQAPTSQTVAYTQIRALNMALQGMGQKARSYPYLRVFSTGSEPIVSFPDIAPIGALTMAVENQITDAEDDVLKEIHAQLEG